MSDSAGNFPSSRMGKPGRHRFCDFSWLSRNTAKGVRHHIPASAACSGSWTRQIHRKMTMPMAKCDLDLIGDKSRRFGEVKEIFAEVHVHVPALQIFPLLRELPSICEFGGS